MKLQQLTAEQDSCFALRGPRRPESSGFVFPSLSVTQEQPAEARMGQQAQSASKTASQGTQSKLVPEQGPEKVLFARQHSDRRPWVV